MIFLKKQQLKKLTRQPYFITAGVLAKTQTINVTYRITTYNFLFIPIYTTCVIEEYSLNSAVRR